MDTSRFPYLQGNYAPVDSEHDCMDLAVEGKVPAELVGAFMRNGPNIAFQPDHYVYPLDGDGMVHAVYFDQGKVRYRNRWVETAGLRAERTLGRRLYGSVGRAVMPPPEALAAGGDPSPLKNVANTNIVRHAGKLLALWEGGYPHLLNDDLSTAGLYTYDGDIPAGAAVSAHPKICPHSGEFITCTQLPVPPYFTVRIIGTDGHLKKSIPVDMPYPVVLHDMQITEHYVIIFCCPALVDLRLIAEGKLPFRWDGALPTRIGVIPRDGSTPTWIEHEAFFCWHFSNAREHGNTLLIDYVWIATLPVSGEVGTGIEAQPRRLHRMTVDLATRSARDEEINPVYCEFTRVDERRLGESCRYSYAIASTLPRKQEYHGYNCVVRHEVDSGDYQLVDFGVGANAGEAVHVPVAASGPETDAFLMNFVTSPAEGSFLSVIDARDFAAGPVAKIRIPWRVPNGFHANWMQGLRHP